MCCALASLFLWPLHILSRWLWFASHHARPTGTKKTVLLSLRVSLNILVDSLVGGSERQPAQVDHMAEEAKMEVAPPAPKPAEDVADEKAAVPSPEESKALVVAESDAEKPAATGGSHERDALLTRVATEKKMSLIKAWEENEKAKAENKAVKLLADITSWENSKAAEMEAELKKMQEQLEKKKARCVEKLKNSAATVHKEAEEKRAAAEARREEEIVAAEEAAAKYRAKGEAPKKLLFGALSRG